MLYNGTPSYRIWIVGTKRVLGIHQNQEGVPDAPDKLLGNLMDPDRVVFADFAVEPLTPYRPGVMQFVRVLSASKIVVTEQGKIVLRRSSL